MANEKEGKGLDGRSKRAPAVIRNYKSTVFIMLFQDKKNLLSLYNALNVTTYESVDELELTTLDNAIYMGYKNDISFLLHHELHLYEHQGSFNPNMPLRMFQYTAQQLEKLIMDRTIYGTRLIKIPVPKFVVFYNGEADQPDEIILKLSDAYEIPQADPELEVKVRMLNINRGHNMELMKACRVLEEYSIYIDRVRTLAKHLPIEEAVEQAVQSCIAENILHDFLLAQRAEVIAMSIFEYNEEVELRKLREEEFRYGQEKGWQAGKAAGLELGQQIGERLGREAGEKIGREAGEKIGREAGEKIGREAGEKIGHEAGLTQGIRAMILDNLEEHKTTEEILTKLERLFSLTRAEAEAHLQQVMQE